MAKLKKMQWIKRKQKAKIRPKNKTKTTTWRYCFDCKTNTYFLFNPAICHSQCTICGNRRSGRVRL